MNLTEPEICHICGGTIYITEELRKICGQCKHEFDLPKEFLDIYEELYLNKSDND